MFTRKNSFLVPEFVAANRQGVLAEKQRRRFLFSGLTLTLGFALLVGGSVALFLQGKVNFIAFILLGAAVLVALAAQEPWKIYREEKPVIVSCHGVLQRPKDFHPRRGGFVKAGDRSVYLSRLEAREVQWGRHHEIFLITPHNTAVSAEVVD